MIQSHHCQRHAYAQQDSHNSVCLEISSILIAFFWRNASTKLVVAMKMATMPTHYPMTPCFAWVLAARRAVSTAPWHRVRRYRAPSTPSQRGRFTISAKPLWSNLSSVTLPMPKALILDLDHSEDPAHGQQPLAFFIFGLGGNSVLQKLAEPTKLRACAVKDLLYTLTERLFISRPVRFANSS